jgi:hypothetical protein
MTKRFLSPISLANIASDPTGVKGSIYYNSGSNVIKYYNGTAWVTLSASSNAALFWVYLATGGETTLSGLDTLSQTLAYTAGAEQVFLNGVLLVRGQDYTATNGTSITLSLALNSGDYVEVVAMVAIALAAAGYAPIASPTFTGTVTLPLTTAGYVKATSGGVISSSSSVPFSDLTSLPSTLAGHGITDGLTSAAAASTYLTISNAGTTYSPIAGSSSITTLGTVTSGSFPVANLSGTTLPSAVVNSSLTKIGSLSAGTAGFVKIDASGNLTSDSSTYLTTSNASSTYLTQTNAASTYLPLTGGTISSNLTVTGNLTVNGTTTNINSYVVSLYAFRLTLGSVASPSDITASGGGIILKGANDKSIIWDSAAASGNTLNTGYWTSTENLNLNGSTKAYYINGTSVLSATTLGSGVTSSSLTSVGTLTNLTVTNPISGSITGNAGTVTNGIYTTTTSLPNVTSVNGITLTPAATGFTVAGGTTSKTLTISNTLTLAGTDTATLNIGGGGTLGTAAFTAATAYAPLTTPQLLTPFIKRVDSAYEGGQIDFARASDGAQAWYLDIYGNTSTPNFRIVDVSNAAVRIQIDGTTGNVSAQGFVKNGGTSAQYLMADGSVSTGSGGGVTSFSAGTTGLTPSTASTGGITLAGTLVVANGGTGTGTAGITAFNNITGYTAAGATGTTSTNLVFSTSPTLTTPKIDSIVTNTGAAAAATLFGDVATGSITIGSTLGSTAANGTINLANNAGITGGTKTINIGTGATAGTTTITIGSATGSTTNILGTAQVGGNAILTSASTINASTLNTQAPSYYADHIIPYTKTGALTTSTGTIRYRLPWAATIIGVSATVNTAPTSGTVVIDVRKGLSATPATTALTIFPTTTKPTIATSGYVAASVTPDTTSLAAGDWLLVDVTAGTGASDLSVFIEIQRA